MKRRQRIKRHTFLPRHTRPSHKARSAEERERIYGPRGYREHVVFGPCAACGTFGTEDRPLHPHHTRTGGTGRKADFQTQAGICWRCHKLFHDVGPSAFQKATGCDLRSVAERTYAAWRELNGPDPTG